MQTTLRTTPVYKGVVRSIKNIGFFASFFGKIDWFTSTVYGLANSIQLNRKMAKCVDTFISGESADCFRAEVRRT